MKSFIALMAILSSVQIFAQQITTHRYNVHCETQSKRTRVNFTFIDNEVGTVMEELIFAIDRASAKTETYHFKGKNRLFLKYENGKYALLKSSVIARELGLININFSDVFKELDTKTPFTFVSEPNFNDGVYLQNGSTFVGKVKNPYNPKGFATSNLLLSMNCSLRLQEVYDFDVDDYDYEHM